MKIVDLDPAEEWLAQYWLGNLYSSLSRDETANKIKERLDEYIYHLLETTRQYKPPYNPDLLFEDRKILKKIETQLPSNRSGILIPTLGGFIMKIKSDEHKYRRRFSIAHEIGHTFFYDITQNIPIIRFNKSKSRYWVQEDYANQIAGTMLLPEPSLKKVIIDNKKPPSLDAFEYLRKLYQVSYDVLHRRIVRYVDIWDCIIFKSTMDSSGAIRTDSTSVCKGISYESWSIPKVLSPQSTSPKEVNESHNSCNILNILREKLYPVVAPVFEDRKFLKECLQKELGYKGIKYSVQSKLLKDNNSNTCITLIVKKDG